VARSASNRGAAAPVLHRSALQGPPTLAGCEVRRLEDDELLRGRARFVDNLPLEGALHLAFVRSPHAHATLGEIDRRAALLLPGVVAVLTADDLCIPAHHGFLVVNETCARPPLARDRVRFAGEAVVVVVARTAAQAVDGARAVQVDYAVLEAVVDPEAALAPGAPLQFPELGSNLATGWRSDPDVDPLAGADVVVRARVESPRVAVVPLEGNAIAVVPGTTADRPAVTAYVSTQLPHAWWQMTADLFGLRPQDLRVVAPDVGGGFGGKVGIVSEHMVAVAVALRLGQTVKWVETRSENLVNMQGRAMVHYGELGLTHDGRMTGLRLRVVGDAGAYAGFAGSLAVGPTYDMAPGPYRIPRVGYDVAVALTNTPPVGGYRGSGRPEATLALERLVDLAAGELQIDPAELRRLNFHQEQDFPLTTAVGTVYDSGAYDVALDVALQTADYAALRQEQARRRAEGSSALLGIGVASYVEVTAGGRQQEWASVSVETDGAVVVSVGTSGHGQGHWTSFAMLVGQQLGVPLESVRLVQADTAVVPSGGGTGGSRSLQLGGNAVHAASVEVVAQGREAAAVLLEASVADIAVVEGGLAVSGDPASVVTWSALAGHLAARGERLRAAVDHVQQQGTFPFGSHVSVVEVDADTGKARLVGHVAVDDCGPVLNPMIVRGQQHGGLAQAVGQALFEQVVFDVAGGSGSGTLNEYKVPSAPDLPMFEVRNTQTPTPLNALGVKGVGEAATVGGLPAVQNAVVDALRHLGVTHVDVPCTPERVWRALQDAGARRSMGPWREPPDVFASLAVRRDDDARTASVL
jgi:carbon-monoxide dehydrogenase large subunit